MGIGAGGNVVTSGEIGLLRRLVPRPDQRFCIFDIGANRGQFLTSVFANIPSRLEMHCFEPSSAAFRELAIIAAGKAHITLNRTALGKETGNVTLYFDVEGSGLASLTKRRLDHLGISFERHERVTVSTVDRYCRERQIDAIDLLKIDVEGHELDVLEGAADMLEQGRIRWVLFEFGGSHIDTRTFLQDFFYFFMRYKMTLSRLTPSGYLSPIPAYSELDEQFTTTSFVARRYDEIL
jgi:FkbM family methyltransferase